MPWGMGGASRASSPAGPARTGGTAVRVSYCSPQLSAYVRLRRPDGTLCSLAPGDLVGRLSSAALHLHDARISEAHSLISLRGGELKLLALRGRFAVAGKVADEVALAPGMLVEFAPGLVVEVVEVVVPTDVLALEGAGLPRQILAGVSSLEVTGRPRLISRYVGEAPAHIWSIGPTWALRIGEEPVRALVAGDTFEVEGVAFTAVEVSLTEAGGARTQAGGLRPPLRIEARFDSVQILRPGLATFAIGGIGARILSELVAFDGPVNWRVIAAEIWTEDDDRALLRSRWDVALSRLRVKLREARLPPDLVRADRSGFVELLLEADDVVVNET